MDKQELERTTYIVVLSLIQIDTLNFHTNIEYNLSSHFCSLYSILPVSEYWFIITLINNRYIRIYIIYILGENVYPDLVGWLSDLPWLMLISIGYTPAGHKKTTVEWVQFTVIYGNFLILFSKVIFLGKNLTMYQTALKQYLFWDIIANWKVYYLNSKEKVPARKQINQ